MDDNEDEINDYDLQGTDLEGIDQGVPVPLMRACFAKRRLTVIVAGPDLSNEASLSGMLFDERAEDGASIMGLGETEEPNGSWDLTVTFRTDGSNEEAERRIVRWAGQVGYGRVWLPDRLVQPPPPPGVDSRAEIRCMFCGQLWHAQGRRFWQMVSGQRLFPNVCALCGATLPQWTVKARSVGPTRCGKRRHVARRRQDRIQALQTALERELAGRRINEP